MVRGELWSSIRRQTLARHGTGKPEPRHHAILEFRYGAHAIAGESDYDKTERMRGAAELAVQVDAVGRLPVCAGRDQPKPTAIPESNGRKPAPGQFTALVLKRIRRHPQPDVVGHQRHQRFGVAFLPGTNQLAEDSPLVR